MSASEDLPILNLSNPLHNRLLRDWIKNRKGIHFVKISRLRDQRTLAQNAYMHGVVFVELAKAMTAAWGTMHDMYSAKDFAKNQFLRVAVRDGNGIVKGWTLRSTSDLNIEECSTFIQRSIDYAMENFGHEIPPASDYEERQLAAPVNEETEPDEFQDALDAGMQDDRPDAW